MVAESEDGARPDRPTDDDELLRQWERRIVAAGDPAEALAELLGERQAARGRQFGRVGELVLGCRLVRILGAGGMGVTYEGQAADGTAVAVKLVAGVAHNARDRFEQECRVLRELVHPAIVRYRAHSVEADGTGVLVMDLVTGNDLELLLTTLSGEAPKQAQLPVVDSILHGIDGRGPALWQSPRYRRRILRLLAEVADGLHAAHERAIVHRDVKPANILVREDLSPVIIDFGLAREVLGRVSFTQSGAAMGTLAYMAPEQLGRDPGAVDGRTDVFALGLVLFRCVSGTDLRQEIGEIVQSSKRAFLLDAKHSRVLSVDIQAILYRCLDPRPAKRYATAAELAHDLRAAAGQGQVQARRPSAIRRFARDPRRLTIAASLALAALLALVWSVWPHGRYVLFSANCDPVDAVLSVDGGQVAWLGDPVWLAYGTHRFELRGRTEGLVHNVADTVDVVQGIGVQRVAIRSYYPKVDPEITKAGVTPLLLMTGHSWVEMAPGVDRDRHLLNGVELQRSQPFVETILAPGRYELKAIDGRGRQEVQNISLGQQPEDVQLLPAVMSPIDGSYRCTWSTVLSPLPPGLQLTSDAGVWLGGPRPSEFHVSVMAAPCALTPGGAGQPATVRLRCTFPEPMRSAVVFLRAAVLEGGLLDVRLSAEGAAEVPWPLRDATELQRMMEVQSETPFRWLEIEATLRSRAAPTSSLALVRYLDGVVFGGHWKEQPPCFAVVADPGRLARIPRGPLAPSHLSSAPKIAAPTVHSVPNPDATFELMGAIACMDGPKGERHLAIAVLPLEGPPRIRRFLWPTSELVATYRAEDFEERVGSSGGAQFGMQMSTLGDHDGDGWVDLVIGDSSSRRLGPESSGSVWRIGSRNGAVLWTWPALLSPAGDQLFQDDCAGSRLMPAGDWNADGIEDLVAGAESWSAAADRVKCGLVEVVDGRSGFSLWRHQGARQQAQCSPVDSVEGSSSEGPYALLLREHIKPVDSDRSEASRWSVLVPGPVVRKMVAGPVLPPHAEAVLLRDHRPDWSGVWSVLVLRWEPWQDGFAGIERYEVSDDGWRLMARQSLAVDPRSLRNRIVRTEDLDGDGCGDAALVFKQETSESGVLFVSGMEVELLGFAPVARDRLEPGSLLWLARRGEVAGRLLVGAIVEQEGVRKPALLAFVPGK